MPEPTAPQIPDDAPQDVKDFFECRGSTLNWQSGDVTWLGLSVTPSVTFAPGANQGDVILTVGILGGMVSFALPASVNAAGELVVDTSSVPDLSEWGLGGRADIDAAIKRINDWFRHNGKKLKPARLTGGTVVLEKVPITPVAAAVPATAPVTPKTPAPPPPPAAAPATGGGCGLLGILMLLMLVGVISVGGYVGFVYFGGPGPAAQASATPSAPPTPSAAPSPTATAAPSPSASVGATPTAAPSPSMVASPSATPGSAVTAACVRVVHQAVGDFISYLDWYMYMFEEDIDHLEVVVAGANNGDPVQLEYDSPSGAYHGILGLHGAGVKTIVSATLVLVDGTTIDVTDDLTDALGGKTLLVRVPQQDSFGSCPPQ